MKWKEADELVASEKLKGIERELQEIAKKPEDEAHVLLATLMHRLYALEDMVAEALYSTTFCNNMN